MPRLSAFLALALAVATSARMERRTHTRRDSVGSQCNTGAVKCCNSVYNATDIATVLDMFSYSYDPADTVGINCTPFNLYGAGEASSCQQQPVCCANNNYTGFINVGCSPMDLD